MNFTTRLHLSLINGIGPTVIQKLSQFPEHTDVYSMAAQDIMQCGISARVAQKVVDGLASHKELEQELYLLEKYRYSVVTLGDANYPSALAAIYMPPPLLYVYGTLPHTEDKAVAFVGSRDGNAYGKNCIEYVIPYLVAQHYGIVSGGARGIDTWAHEAALKAHGKTYAVIGSGLLRPYPFAKEKN